MSKPQIKACEDIRDYPTYWAKDLVPAKFLPTTRAEMEKLGWDSCDVIIVSGDAYVDLPSFCTAVVGRFLESFGYRVGVIAQPDWHSKDAFMALGKPNLFFGVTAGNMDSMINHYTADRKIRTDDAYTPGNVAGKRPDRAVTVYSQRLREAYKDVPIILGGIEASLRRIAHYDYWSDNVRNSVLMDSKADILVYGNGERPLAEIAARLASGESVKDIKDVRGTAVMVRDALPGWYGIDLRTIEHSALINPLSYNLNPYNPDCPDTLKNKTIGALDLATATNKEVIETLNELPEQNSTLENSNKNYLSPVGGLNGALSEIVTFNAQNAQTHDKKGTLKTNVEDRIDYSAKVTPSVKKHELEYILLPSAEKVKQDKLAYAQTAHIFITETNPECARALMQKHGERYVWVNPPAFVLTTPELDYVYALPFQRVPHPCYGDAKIPAFEMIKTSVSLMRGCFGGCSFCSIVAHEGKRIQSRSSESVLQELTEINEKTPGFTGVISDLGGPSANMYKLECTNEKARKVCRKPSCLYPEVCKHMKVDHGELIELYRKARDLPFIKKILIASGVRIDLALKDKRYIKELVLHHVGGYLKIAPEHTESEVLQYMLKPGVDVYYKFKELFESYSSSAGKKQYLIPYFMSAHPGSTLLSMIKLAVWLKRNDFRVDQVQNFYPTPMAGATSMYYTGLNPYKAVKNKDNEMVFAAKGEISRRTQKAILRYHDENNQQVIREVLRELGLEELIGRSKDALVPPGNRLDKNRPIRAVNTNKNNSNTNNNKNKASFNTNSKFSFKDKGKGSNSNKSGFNKNNKNNKFKK